MKIKNLLTFVFGLFALATVIIFAVTSAISRDNETADDFTVLIDELAQKQADNVKVYVTSLEGGFSAFAKNVKAADEAERSEILSAYSGRSDITAAEFFAKDSDEAKAFAGLQNGKLYALSDKKADEKYTLAIKDETEDGVIALRYSADNIKNIIASAAATNGRVLFILPNGAVLDKNSYYESLGVVSQDQADHSGVKGFLDKNQANGRFNKATIKMYARIQDVSGTDWKVAAVGSISGAQKEAASNTSLIVIITVLLCVIGIVATALVVKTFTRPIDTISRTIMQIRRGDHDARINIMTNNEYGEIARQFNDLIDDIVVGESRYRTIIEMSDNIIFEWNKRNNEVSFSNNFNKKFSFRATSDHFGDSFLMKCKVHPDDSARYKADLAKLDKGEDFKQNEYRIKNIYNDYTWYAIKTASVKDGSGAISKTIGVLVDIDRAKKSEESLMNRASFDALTGVYNRDSIEDLIENEIELIDARKEEFAVIFVDIDDFKDFNDNFSHATGDQVLKFVAQSLKNIVEGFGMVGRYGGDEFIVCVKNSEVNEPSRIAEEILNRLKEGYTATDTGDRISINASIGGVTVRDSAKRVELVVGAADDAMYKIKKGGKANFFIETNDA